MLRANHQSSRRESGWQTGLTFLATFAAWAPPVVILFLLGDNAPSRSNVLVLVWLVGAWAALAAIEERIQSALPIMPAMARSNDTPWRRLALVSLWAVLPAAAWSLGTSGPAIATGAAMIAAGAGLRIWSLATLGPYFTPHTGVLADHRLIRSGPYRYLNHPNYLGSVLLAFGMAMTAGAGLAMFPAVLVLLGCLITAHRESAFLRTHLPGYAAQTPTL